MGFQLTPLAGVQVLVEGTDIRGNFGTEILDSTQWAAIKRNKDVTSALEAVDQAIATLIAPIQEAAEKVNATIAGPALDPMLYVVEQEAVEHQCGSEEIVTKLNRDAVILRAIEEGASDRLLWVNGSLVLTAKPQTAPAPTTSGDVA